MSMRACITFRPPPPSGQPEERRIIEDQDRFTAQDEAALRPVLLLILHLVFLHVSSPLQSELDRHGPAGVSLEGDARLRREVRHAAR